MGTTCLLTKSYSRGFPLYSPVTFSTFLFLPADSSGKATLSRKRVPRPTGLLSGADFTAKKDMKEYTKLAAGVSLLSTSCVVKVKQALGLEKVCCTVRAKFRPSCESYLLELCDHRENEKGIGLRGRVSDSQMGALDESEKWWLVEKNVSNSGFSPFFPSFFLFPSFFDTTFLPPGWTDYFLVLEIPAEAKNIKRGRAGIEIPFQLLIRNIPRP